MSNKSTTVRTEMKFPVLAHASMRVLSHLAPSFAAKAGERLFRSPRQFAPPPREQAWLTGAVPLDLRMGTRRIAAWSWGEGARTVVMMHGWEGRGSQLGAFAEPLVAAGFRVVAFDAPGHGQSGGTISSVPEFVDALWAVRRAIGPIDTLVAHSLGAAAAAKAVVEGLRLRKAIFLAPPATLGDIPSRFGALVGLTPKVTHRMQSNIEERFQIRFDHLDLRRFGEGVELPLLIVHDKNDRDVPWQEGASVAEAWPRAQLMTTESLGHRRLLRDSAVLEACVRFIARNPTGIA